MSLIDFKDSILLLIGAVLSVASGLIGSYLQRRLDRWFERRPLNQLLNFGPDELVVVFPHRRTNEEILLLPRTSTEDFLAVNNFISALLKIGWNRKIVVRDVSHVSAADKQCNLAIICSTKSNALASELQAELERNKSAAFRFKDAGGKFFVEDKEGAPYHSSSYSQIDKYLTEGVKKEDLPGRHFEDFAIITKVRSPWRPDRKVLWLAGIRGFGTWGAAECIKKAWSKIYDQLPHEQKDCDFSALLKVSYDNCDITSVIVSRVEVLGAADSD